MKKLQKIITATAIAMTMASTSFASELIINSDQADPAPKAVFDNMVEQFKQENPDITVKYNLYDKEAYKTTLRNWLVTSPPDVVFWHAGTRHQVGM